MWKAILCSHSTDEMTFAVNQLKGNTMHTIVLYVFHDFFLLFACNLGFIQENWILAFSHHLLLINKQTLSQHIFNCSSHIEHT